MIKYSFSLTCSMGGDSKFLLQHCAAAWQTSMLALVVMIEGFCNAVMEVSVDGDMPTSSLATSLRRLYCKGSFFHLHLETGGSPSPIFGVFTVSGETAPGTLTVVDNRTGKKYESKISKGGTVKAMNFKKVNENKIKVFPASSLSVCSQRHRVSTYSHSSVLSSYQGTLPTSKR